MVAEDEATKRIEGGVRGRAAIPDWRGAGARSLGRAVTSSTGCGCATRTSAELLTDVPRLARAGRGARGARALGAAGLARGRAREWLERESWRELGRSLRGIEQVKHWSISSVLRIETDGPDLYFKVSARLPLFVEEASVTAMLAERFPGYVPAPLAVEPDAGLVPAAGVRRT